jgi:hypothetical protein
MSKNTNLSFLTDYITADITNGRIGINTPSPAYSFDVTGIARTSTSTYLATASGNVGIGTTSPDQLLSVRKTSAGAETIALALQNIGGTANTAVAMIFCPHENSTTPEPLAKISAIRTAASGALTDLAFYTFITPGGLTERMRITSGGNVGINTSDPQFPLHILNTSAATITNGLMLQNAGNSSSTGTGVRLSFKLGGFSGSEFRSYAAIDAVTDAANNPSIALVFSTPNYGILFPPNERMRITGSGNVGIGTSNPGYTLQVAGTAVASNFFSVEGTQYVVMNVWTTFYTLAADQGIYSISIGLGENVMEIWYACGIVFSAISRSIFLSLANGSIVQIRTQGLAVQVFLPSTAGANRTLNYKILRS